MANDPHKDGTAFRPTIDLHPLAGTEITRVGKNPLQGVHFNSDLIAVMDDSDVVRLALATLAECYLIAAGKHQADADREREADQLADQWAAAHIPF